VTPFEFRKLVRKYGGNLGAIEACPLGVVMRARRDDRSYVSHPQALLAAKELGLDGSYCLGVARGWDSERLKVLGSGEWLRGWRYGRRMKLLVWGRRVGVRAVRKG
jgi:hypothetical protein